LFTTGWCFVVNNFLNGNTFFDPPDCAPISNPTNP
jgi:hypothetical protein